MKDEFKRCSRREVGHGGMKCSCCRPASKKRHRRMTRARMKMQVHKIAQDFKN
jgi:hypothetical protein